MLNWFYAQKPAARKYGWNYNEKYTEEELATRPELSSYKTFKYHPNLGSVKNVDLSGLFPKIFDQGQLGSCTSNAIISSYEYTMNKERETPLDMSRLGLYYMERDAEGNTDTDSGAQIKTGVNILHDKGAGLESLCPYDISKFAVKPSDAFYDDLQYHKAVKIERVKKDIKDIDQCLLDGCPVIFGFLVYSSFESQEVATTGYVPIPNPSKETLLGGHAVVCTGFFEKDGKQYYKVRNSWGENWGDKGYFYVEKKFMTTTFGTFGLQSLCSDLWTIQKVEDDVDPNVPKTKEQKLACIKENAGVDQSENSLDVLLEGVRNLAVDVEVERAAAATVTSLKGSGGKL